MTIYAIGAVNGDYEALVKLLEQIQFNHVQDQLWFSGNIVNHGPKSLEILRFVKDLGRSAVAVLGYQELRLLAIAEGVMAEQDDDKVSDILAAQDRDQLLKWLYQRPFLHHQANYTLVHGGIPAEWSLSQARTFAIEAESSLVMGNHKTFFENIFADTPNRWHPKLRGWKRLRFIVNALTRISYCDDSGRCDFNGAKPNDSYTPWYQHPNRMMAKHTILCTNTLGIINADTPTVIPLSNNNNALYCLALPSNS